MSGVPILSLLIALPAVAALAILLIPRRHEALVLRAAVAGSLGTLAVAIWLLVVFEVGEGGFQFVEQATFHEPWGVGWHLGVDGISLLLVVLTAVLFPIALAASGSITHRVRGFAVCMLLLEAAILGVFLTLDLLVFFVFWEAMLIPMYFIIGIWGGERRIHAALKFVIYTALGSAIMFAAILALALMGGAGGPTFDFVELLGADLTRTTQMWLFIAFAVSFFIKIPVFPFHTWLPDAHVEAPTAGSVILAGVLLKLGAYGLLRFNLTLFPEAAVSLMTPMAVLAVIGIVYGGVVAIVQPDIKRLVAYSSVSHMGFVLLGIVALTSTGMQGGVLQMVNHGITTGALFLLVGMIYERRHTRQIADFGGLATVMPIYAAAFLFTAFASIGLPGLNGFVGEFFVLVGAYLTLPTYAIIGAVGVILAAVYMLWAYQRMFTGEIKVEENRTLTDLRRGERLVLLPLLVLMLAIGLYPKPALDRIEPSVEQVIQRIELVTDYEEPRP